MIVTAETHARFYSKVRGGPNCWEWTGALRGPGLYGVFTVGRKNISAHRFAYELQNGRIPDGLNILHSCDNKKCVRPSHLAAGTQSKNIKDCVRRGRHIAPLGERNGMAVLTKEQVNKIRSMYDGKRGSITRLAIKNGISVSAVHAIVRGNRWKEGANGK